MSDEQEQERDGYPEATTIGPNVNAAQLELDIDAISRRTRKFLVEQQNTIDRLTAERDAARAEAGSVNRFESIEYCPECGIDDWNDMGVCNGCGWYEGNLDPLYEDDDDDAAWIPNTDAYLDDEGAQP